jgi:hypothetical protein
LCSETAASLQGYLEACLDNARTGINLASLIGNRFLSLNDFQRQTLGPSTRRCFEFLFLHEVVFEILIRNECIRRKIKLEATISQIEKMSNNTLRRIMSMQWGVEEQQITHEKLKPVKVACILSR